MTKVPENQIHHLKESLEESSFQKKIPWLLLLSFIFLVIVSSLIYVYQYRDLPKCQDESVQILLNQNIRNNEVLIEGSQTIAFEDFRENSHGNSQRSCVASLITNRGKYLVSYQVQNDLIEKNWISRFTGAVEYSVFVEKTEPSQ